MGKAIGSSASIAFGQTSPGANQAPTDSTQTQGAKTVESVVSPVLGSKQPRRQAVYSSDSMASTQPAGQRICLPHSAKHPALAKSPAQTTITTLLARKRPLDFQASPNPTTSPNSFSKPIPRCCCKRIPSACPLRAPACRPRPRISAITPARRGCPRRLPWGALCASRLFQLCIHSALLRELGHKRGGGGLLLQLPR